MPGSRATVVPRSYAPMEAMLVAQLPAGAQWQYEPKWDGFRCLAFRHGDQVELRSKSGQPLDRYFPEVVAALREVRATTFVLDGELVVPVGALSFDDLLQRVHPAASRPRVEPRLREAAGFAARSGLATGRDPKIGRATAGYREPARAMEIARAVILAAAANCSAVAR